MSEDVQVRYAQLADRDTVWPLACDFATTFDLDHDRYNSSFERRVAEPNTLLIIAHLPTAEVVGYLLAFSHTTFLANGPVAWVEEVMVAEQARRGGIGRRLIATAEDWSASIGAAYIALATRRAAGFYLALGYTESAAFFRKLTTTTEPGVRAKGTSGLYGLPRRHLTALRVSSWHFALVATDAK